MILRLLSALLVLGSGTKSLSCLTQMDGQVTDKASMEDKLKSNTQIPLK